MKKHYLTAGIFSFFLAFDIITKKLILSALKFEGNHIDIIGSFVQFRLIFNRGGVFGILQGYQSFFLIVSCIVLTILFGFYYIERKNTSMIFFTAMGLIFSGAVGNILDRVPKVLGMKDAIDGVVDFIYIGVDGVYRWPAFNVADSAIVVGAFLLFILFWIDAKNSSKSKEEK